MSSRGFPETSTGFVVVIRLLISERERKRFKNSLAREELGACTLVSTGNEKRKASRAGSGFERSFQPVFNKHDPSSYPAPPAHDSSPILRLNKTLVFPWSSITRKRTQNDKRRISRNSRALRSGSTSARLRVQEEILEGGLDGRGTRNLSFASDRGRRF
jgi:hypothetical protein